MSVLPRKTEQQTVFTELTLPSLTLLFNKTLDIAGTGKRKIDGEYAATRLGKSMTSRWANERFRQVMLLIRVFRTDWPNKSLLTSDDTEFIRSAVDVALSSAAHEEHNGDVYDLNSTTWAIWLVQHVRVVRLGSWTAESALIQHSLSFEHLYGFLEDQHARDDRFNVKDLQTNQLIHRYKLPFKSNMRIPPKKNELFKWKKGAKRLSDWMEQGGFAPIDPGIQNLEPAKLVAAPPLQSQREAARAAMWGRVAERARARTLTSVQPEGQDAILTRNVVSSVMNASRADAPTMMADEEVDAFAQELEAELESQQQAVEPPLPPPQSAHSSATSLSEYEEQRLRNIAWNQCVLEGLGLFGVGRGPPVSPAPAREPFPPGRSGAAPSRRSNVERKAVDYAGGDSDAISEDEVGEGQEVDGTGAPPPGAVVIDLVSDEEEEHTPALLPSDLTRRDGLFVAASQVTVESGPSTGSTLQEPGLFTSLAIPPGSFVCFYTGTYYSTEAFESLPSARRDALSKYAVEVENHAVTIAPAVDAAGKVDLTLHAAAAANEPSASSAANSFAHGLLAQTKQQAQLEEKFSGKPPAWLDWAQVQTARARTVRAYECAAEGGTETAGTLRKLLFDATLLTWLTSVPPDRVGISRLLRLGDTLQPTASGFDLDLSRPGQHKTSAVFGPTVTAVPAPAAALLTAWLGSTGRTGAAQPHVFVPGADASKPLGAPQWTKLVKGVFKKHAGVALAPKELRSSFITFLRSGDNSDAALQSAAFAMRHSSAQARGPAYDKERAQRLSAAAVQVAGTYAAGFK